MEHAADALKMAFALLVFAIAITTIFVMVSKVKTTSDAVMYYGDKTNFYSHYEDKSKDTNGNRIVGISDIVFCAVDEAGSQGIFRGFVHVVHP